MKPAVIIPKWASQPLINQAMPAWLNEQRELYWQQFLHRGLPTRKNERFKYIDFTFLQNKNFSLATRDDDHDLQDAVFQHRLQYGESLLLVLVNGYFMPEYSDISKLPAGVIACNLAKAIEEHADLIKPSLLANNTAGINPFSALNAAMGMDGLFLYIPTDCKMNVPVHLLSLVTDKNEFIAHPKHTIILEENSQLVLVEEYFSLPQYQYFMNVATSLFLGKQARCAHYKLQNESKQAIHLANATVTQQQDSHYQLMNFAAGSQLARDEVIVKLQQPGAQCSATGFYHLRTDQQFIDYHLDIQHAAPLSHSEMLYKGILEKKSCAVFNGRLLVEKDAQKILAYQANHNLLLSDEAAVYSKPELEIYADDVKCKHGATTGQLDQDALFYLRSRGIAEDDAIEMLLEGFAEEIMQRVLHAGIKMRVQEII